MDYKLTLNDLRALMVLVDNCEAQKIVEVSKFPELARRWSLITPLLKDYGFRGYNISVNAISFVSEQSLNAFAAHVEDWLAEAEEEREIKLSQKKSHKATYLSAAAALISALCALLTIIARFLHF